MKNCGVPGIVGAKRLVLQESIGDPRQGAWQNTWRDSSRQYGWERPHEMFSGPPGARKHGVAPARDSVLSAYRRGYLGACMQLWARRLILAVRWTDTWTGCWTGWNGPVQVITTAPDVSAATLRRGQRLL